MIKTLNTLSNGKKEEFKKIGKSIYKIVLSNYKGQKTVQFYKLETNNGSETPFEAKDFSGFPKLAKDNGEFSFERGDKFTVIKWTPSIACLKSEANLSTAFEEIINYIEHFGNPVLDKKVKSNVETPISTHPTPFKNAIINGKSNSKVEICHPVKPVEEEVSVQAQDKLHELIALFQRSNENMEKNQKLIDNFNLTISSLETELTNAIKLVAKLPEQIEAKKAELLEVQNNYESLKKDVAETHANVSKYLSDQAQVWQ